ncbi:MAG: hypothetical protein ACTHK3_01075 [Solirubrobacterales bacterium]
MAIAGPGTASATVICKVKETPCSEANEWALGTFGDATLKAGTSAVMEGGGFVIITCTGGTVSGKLENRGGPFETVHQKGGPENVKWEKCTNPMTTLKGGQIEVHHIAGTYNGTVILKEFETTVFITNLGVSCNYSYGTSTDVGVITGGETPTMDISAVLAKSAGSFLCPSSASGKAEGVLTEPKGGAYIEDE